MGDLFEQIINARSTKQVNGPNITSFLISVILSVRVYYPLTLPLRDYMSSKELLCALWSEDYGDECPNPDTPSILNKNSLPSKTKIPNSLGESQLRNNPGYDYLAGLYLNGH